MKLFGIPVTTHPLAEMQVPVRKHKRQRWMSDNYHRRIQKKWTKRFGTKPVPCAFFVSLAAAGLPGPDQLILHPSIEMEIRKIATFADWRGGQL